MDLEFFLESSEYGNGVLYRRLIDQNLLESSLKSGVFFNVLSVLIESSCADAVKFSSGELRLEEVSGIHRAFCPACPNDIVYLINKQDDPAV